MNKHFTKRNPAPALMFHTKQTRDFGIGGEGASVINPVSHILKISTNASINAAHGSFTIDLVWFKAQASDIEPFYYAVLQPLDVVDIKMDGVETTMLGLIDRVSKSEVITAKGVQRSVSLVGRSLGAIWIFDLVKYFENALGLEGDLKQKNLELQQGDIAFDFFQKPTYEAVLQIAKTLPGLDIQLKNGSLKDWIDLESALFVRDGELLFNSQLSPYSGTIWDYFKQYILDPFNELWTDAKGGKMYLRSRPTPFSILDPETAINPKQESITVGWNEITNWIDGKNGHIITEDLIRGENLAVQHGTGYSVFSVLPGDRFTGSDGEYATFPPLVDSDLVHEIGTRDKTERLSYIPLNADGETVEGSTLDKYKYYRNKLYLWNRDNHRFEAGSLTTRGMPNVRAGDKAIRPATGMEYYVPAVGNKYEYGKPSMTNISVDRGMDPFTREKLYKAGMDFVGGMN